MAKVGRPTKYSPAFNEQARKLCLLGATDAQLADFFGTSEQTVNAWKKAHPSFLESMKNGKQVADANVADALYHRALGYSHPAVKIMSYEGDSWEHKYIERYPPDTAAAFIWLKNRAGWRDKQDVDLRTPEGIEVRTVRLPAVEQDANEWAALHRGAATPNGKNGHGRR